MDFWRKLEDSVTQRNSLLCVGLDPVPERIPASYSGVADFNKGIIDATADLACAYKPNIAFYEALGQEGERALRETLAHIPSGTPVLLDAKRGDVSSTAAAYAKAVFEGWGVDAVTVNPYLGRDGVDPFLEYADRGVFVLCKTSNPSAGEIQDWTRRGVPLFHHIARLAQSWGDTRQIGLVVGATYSEAILDIRNICPKSWFLVPGIGAQGGDLEAMLGAGLRRDGGGVLVNSSRGIIYSRDPRAAAGALRDRINACRDRAAGDRDPCRARRRDLTSLALSLHEAGCVRFGDFVLHSGERSPIYIDLRRLVSYPVILEKVAREYARLLKRLSYDRIAAIPYAGLPIGTAVSLEAGRPLIYPRREVKSYGTGRQIEGEYTKGERAVLLDDLISSGESKLEAAAPLRDAGLTVEDVVVLIDREQGGRDTLARKGCRLHSAITLRELVSLLARAGKISLEKARVVDDYLAGKGSRS